MLFTQVHRLVKCSGVFSFYFSIVLNLCLTRSGQGATNPGPPNVLVEDRGTELSKKKLERKPVEGPIRRSGYFDQNVESTPVTYCYRSPHNFLLPSRCLGT